MGFGTALNYGLLYELPLWKISLILIVMFVISEEIGYRVGLHHRQRLALQDAESGGGGLIQNSIFALLGLILAFTYAAAVDRHEERRQAIVEEANALGTAYLRADTLSEPSRTELKQALLDYAITRLPDPKVKVRFDNEQRAKALQRSLAAQQKIWPLTLQAISTEQRAPFAFGLVIAINEVLDQHTVRLNAITHKLPIPAFYFLIIISAAALAITGFNAGVQGHLGRWRAYGFALLLMSLLLIIMDFDRPNDGIVSPPHSSMASTIADMQADLAQ